MIENELRRGVPLRSPLVIYHIVNDILDDLEILMPLANQSR
jgi:hypothetical protein